MFVFLYLHSGQMNRYMRYLVAGHYNRIGVVLFKQTNAVWYFFFGGQLQCFDQCFHFFLRKRCLEKFFGKLWLLCVHLRHPLIAERFDASRLWAFIHTTSCSCLTLTIFSGVCRRVVHSFKRSHYFFNCFLVVFQIFFVFVICETAFGYGKVKFNVEKVNSMWVIWTMKKLNIEWIKTSTVSTSANSTNGDGQRMALSLVI